MSVTDLTQEEYGAFYRRYTALVPPTITLRSAFDDSSAGLSEYLHELADGREDYAYAPGKWTIKQAVQHLIDTERVFAGRALRLGRHDTTPLPGFDQDAFAAHADVSHREFERMIAELETVRKTTISLFNGFGEADLMFRGTVSGGPMSCRAAGFIICGHSYHHLNVFRERY